MCHISRRTAFVPTLPMVAPANTRQSSRTAGGMRFLSCCVTFGLDGSVLPRPAARKATSGASEYLSASYVSPCCRGMGTNCTYTYVALDQVLKAMWDDLAIYDRNPKGERCIFACCGGVGRMESKRIRWCSYCEQVSEDFPATRAKGIAPDILITCRFSGDDRGRKMGIAVLEILYLHVVICNSSSLLESKPRFNIFRTFRVMPR